MEAYLSQFLDVCIQPSPPPPQRICGFLRLLTGDRDFPSVFLDFYPGFSCGVLVSVCSSEAIFPFGFICFFIGHLDVPYVLTRFWEPYFRGDSEGHFRPADPATPPGTGYGVFLFLFALLEPYSCTSC